MSLLVNKTAKKVTTSHWSGVVFLMLTPSFTTPYTVTTQNTACYTPRLFIGIYFRF